jgi:hypothetical protein
MMTAQQRKYATERVAEIEKQRLAANDETHSTPGVSLTPKERFDLLVAGKVPLVAGRTEVGNAAYVYQVFDFSAFESPARIDTEARDKGRAAIRKEAAAIRDKIMLGDADEALQLLSAFTG